MAQEITQSMTQPITESIATAPLAETAPAGSVQAKIAFAGRILCVVVPVAFWFAPLGLARNVQHALAITLFMIIAWITEAMDHAITGFIGCYLFWVLKVVSFSAAFSGFADDTAWFLWGALLFGIIATKSGLARRIAYLIMLKVGNSYSRILLGLIICGFLLTAVVPSAIARVVIMASIALGLAEVFGVGKGSNIGRGMFMILTYTANIFDKMIIAGASSITARGLIEKVGHVPVYYSLWFIAYLPCSVITVVAAWQLALWLYPPEIKQLPGGAAHFQEELDKMGKWTKDEKKSIFFLVLALALWLTDFWHHLSPSMVGLGIGLLVTLPRIGTLKVDDFKNMNCLPVFFVAAAVSMGNVLVSTKALDVLTNFMFAWMTPLVKGGVYGSTLVLYWTAFVYHIFLASEISMLGTSIPLVMKFAIDKHLNPLALGMVWTFAAGGKIFVYQSGVMIVGYSYGYFETRDMFKVGIWLTVVESIILILLVPFYWPLLGIR